MTSTSDLPSTLSTVPTAVFPDFTPFTIETAPDVTIYGLHAGSGPPLLLLHGWPQTLAIWAKTAPSLLPHFTLVLLDLRGYGRSSKPRSPAASNHSLYSKSTMAADCLAAMQHLGHQRFSILSHDRGARVAHKLATDHPAAVERVLFLDICPTLAMYNATNKALATAYYHWFFLIQPSPFPEDAITGAAAAWAAKTLASVRGIVAREVWEEYEAVFARWDSVHAFCEDYRAAASVDLEEQRADREGARKMRCEVGVVWGRKGVIEKAFDARKEWEEVSEEGCVLLAEGIDCGHFIPEEAPDELLKIAMRFFKVEK